MIRIGLPIIDSSGWHGGHYYFESVLRAFAPSRDKNEVYITLILDRQAAAQVTNTELLALADDCVRVGVAEKHRTDLSLPVLDIVTYSQIVDVVDIVMPVNSDILFGLPHVSWIPDFQHVDMPALFAIDDIEQRDESFNRIRDYEGDVILSSHTMALKLRELWPNFGGRVHVAPFAAALKLEMKEHTEDICAKYEIKGEYFICCNQFWRHKNHSLLIQAFDFLCRSEPKFSATLVLTGARSDYRSAQEDFIPVDRLAALEAEGRIKILGFIPRTDQIQLFQQALAVVQPSLYEGWSTSLEEARWFGKEVIASDIAVHREQNLPRARYFAIDSECELANHLKDVWNERSALPSSGVTDEAWQAGEAMRVDFGKMLLEVAATARFEWERRVARSPVEGRLELNVGQVLWSQRAGLVAKEAVINEMRAELAAREALKSRFIELEVQMAVFNAEVPSWVRRISRWAVRHVTDGKSTIKRIMRRRDTDRKT